MLQSLHECRKPGLSFRVVRGHVHEHADAPHALALLRPRRERPSRRAADERDERTSVHSITSSARAESPGGTSSPGVLAVFGYQEGRNFTFDYIQTPNIEGYEKNYRELATRKVDVFLAVGNEPALRAALSVADGSRSRSWPSISIRFRRVMWRISHIPAAARSRQAVSILLFVGSVMTRRRVTPAGRGAPRRDSRQGELDGEPNLFFGPRHACLLFGVCQVGR